MRSSKKLSVLLCVGGGVLLLAGLLPVVIHLLSSNEAVGIIGGAGTPTLFFLLHGIPTVLLLALGAVLLLAGICRLLFSKQK